LIAAERATRLAAQPTKQISQFRICTKSSHKIAAVAVDFSTQKSQNAFFSWHRRYSTMGEGLLWCGGSRSVLVSEIEACVGSGSSPTSKKEGFPHGYSRPKSNEMKRSGDRGLQ